MAGVATLLATIPAIGQDSLVLTPKWSVAAGSRYYLPTTGNVPRGATLNPLTGNVLVVALNGGSNHVARLSGLDGSDLPPLWSVAAIQSANVNHISQIRVAEDGVIYGCNLDTLGNGRIFRWDGEDYGTTNPPTLAFSGSGLIRFGDGMAVRGAGTNTQIMVTAQGTTNIFFLNTTDGTNFTLAVIPTRLPAGAMSRGVVFNGSSNAVYGMAANTTPLYYLSFDPATSNSTSLATNTLPTASGMLSMGVTNNLRALATIQDNGGAATHRLRVWDFSNPSAIVQATGGDVAFPAPGVAAANVTGATEIGAGMVIGMNTHNGVVALNLKVETGVAPAITAEPVSLTVLENTPATFSVNASGSNPLRYQWYFNTNTPITAATNATLVISNATLASAGTYSVTVTNGSGSTNSAFATLVVTPGFYTLASAPLWRLTNGSRSYINANNLTRGIAFNPATGNLLVADRASTNIVVLNGGTGAELWTLDTSTLALYNYPGRAGFPVNMVGAGDDGAVYVCNLSSDDGSDLTIYRWGNDTSDPGTNTATLAYFGNPGLFRMGDAMAVRGAGTNTQILLSGYATNALALFTTTDGLNFSPTIIDLSHVANLVSDFARVGIAFGEGDTFWAKNLGINLRKVAFDLANNTNQILVQYGSAQSLGPIGVDPINQMLAGVSIENPDTLRVYDVRATPALMDIEFFPSDNAAPQGNGAVTFDVAGGRIFALNAVNGLLAVKYAPPLRIGKVDGQNVLTWGGPGVLQASPTVTGAFTNVAGATSPYTNSLTGSLFFRLQH
jgi:hypothetical protein